MRKFVCDDIDVFAILPLLVGVATSKYVKLTPEMIVGVANVKMGFSIPSCHEKSPAQSKKGETHLHTEKMLEE